MLGGRVGGSRTANNRTESEVSRLKLNPGMEIGSVSVLYQPIPGPPVTERRIVGANNGLMK